MQKRRLEIKTKLSFTNKQVILIDDYAHHPVEIEATYQSLRQKYPKAKIAAIFEPHRYSRSQKFTEQFVKTLSEFDYLTLYPTYSASEENNGYDSDFLAKLLNCKVIDNVLSCQDWIEQTDADILIAMGAGNISENLTQKLCKL